MITFELKMHLPVLESIYMLAQENIVETVEKHLITGGDFKAKMHTVSQISQISLSACM